MYSRALRALLGHPELWPIALVTGWRLARPRWWRHWPPFPSPDPAYLRFRLLTAYGDAGAPRPEELVAYLAWCRRMEVVRAKSPSWSQRRASLAGVSSVPPAADSPVPNRHRRSRQG